MYFCLQVDVCISVGGGWGWRGVTYKWQFTVFCNFRCLGHLFSRFHSFGVLVRCLSFKDFANVQYFWGMVH